MTLDVISFSQVSDFTWSHDGTQALIAYRDGFVLVGSVSGQRHWSSEINLESQITCGIWTPDDQQVNSLITIDLSFPLWHVCVLLLFCLLKSDVKCSPSGLVWYSRWTGDSDGLSWTNACPRTAARVWRDREHVLELPWLPGGGQHRKWHWLWWQCPAFRYTPPNTQHYNI